jgi:uncharacterized protein YbaR (Trm112 family)
MRGKKMKKDIIDILCCPVCKKELILKIEKEEKNEIIKGFFTCKKCNKVYHISEGIIDFLPKK